MASSNGACACNKCEFSSCARCHCCNQDLCIDHIKEHKDQLNVKLIPLTDQLNTLLDSLEHFSSNFDELDKWRLEAHQTIDDFCGRLRQQFSEERKKKPREQLQQIQTSVVLLLQKQGATRENVELLTKSIDSVREQLNALQSSQLTLKPLTIDNDLILLLTADTEPAAARLVHKRPSPPSQTHARNVHQSAQKNEKNSNQLVKPKFANQPRVVPNLTHLTLFVRIFDKIHSFETNVSDSILQLKRTIQDKQGIPVDQQRLSFMGKVLRDEYCVAMTDIQNHSTLDFYIAYRSLPNENQNADEAPRT